MMEIKPHLWTKSTLGHGESMCQYCHITNREAAVLGTLNHCDKSPLIPEDDRWKTVRVIVEIRTRDKSFNTKDLQWHLNKKALEIEREIYNKKPGLFGRLKIKSLSRYLAARSKT
jgi:hypothetical protein